jgi:hypothetical protein
LYFGSIKLEIGMRGVNKNYLVLLIVILLSLIIISSIPTEYLFSKPSLCLHYRLFGIQCPFCGTLRAVYCFLHLDFAGSWQYNYNVFFLALLLPILIARIFTGNRWIKRIERIILIILAIGFSLIYIIRLTNLI